HSPTLRSRRAPAERNSLIAQPVVTVAANARAATRSARRRRRAPASWPPAGPASPRPGSRPPGPGRPPRRCLSAPRREAAAAGPAGQGAGGLDRLDDRARAALLVPVEQRLTELRHRAEMVVEGTLRQSHALAHPVQGQRRGAEGTRPGAALRRASRPCRYRGAALLWSPVSAARPAIPPRNI